DPNAEAIVAVTRQVVANLEGRTAARDTLSGDGFDEHAFVRGLEGGASASTFAASGYYVAKGLLRYLHGDCEGALAMAEEGEKYRESIIGTQNDLELMLYTCLALAAVLRTGGPGTLREPREARLRELHARLGTWAESCPANYLHRHRLVAAERAWLSGD